MTPSCSFKLAHYRETLEAYKDAGYKTIDYRQRYYRLANQLLVLRHDVDFGGASMLKMAGIERDLGCRATYFFRLHGRYNPASFEYVRRARALLEMGHEIGLHYEQFNGRPDAGYLDAARMMLERLYGGPATLITQHYTATDNVDLSWYEGMTDVTFCGLDGYGKYLSDSGGRWREGCFCRWIRKEPVLFVNTHPVWWYETAPQENF